MADGGFSASWASGDDLERLPSWAQYQIGYRTIKAAYAKEDADKTLFVQLTYPELALIPFALLVTSRVFPELAGLAGRVCTKLNELSEAQEYLGRGSTEDEE